MSYPVKDDENGSKLGPDLPTPLYSHQIVSFTDENIGYVSMVIGGCPVLNHGSNKTYYYIHENQTWIEGPDLKEKRMEHAAAVVVEAETKEELVVVTGGATDYWWQKDQEGNVLFLATTDILIDGNWISGESHAS